MSAMFLRATDIRRFKAGLSRWIGTRLVRSLSCLFGLCLFGLCLLSMMLPFPHPMSASSQIGHRTNVTPILMVQGDPMTLPNSIFRRWIHSQEEDRGGVMVYRPIDYPFPLARGREGLEFRQNGELIYYQIAPTDGSLAVPGRWSLQAANTVKIQFSNPSISSYTLTILECDEQILKVKQ
ncbi:MAG: hypothetical protein ACRC8A_03245 [Microcoleaceae cyanobacterium]